MSIIVWSCVLSPDQVERLRAKLASVLVELRSGRSHQGLSHHPALREAVDRYDARSINTLVQWSENLEANTGLVRSFIDTSRIPFPLVDDDSDDMPSVAYYRERLHHCVRALALKGMQDEMVGSASRKLTHEFDAYTALCRTLDEVSETALEPADEAIVLAWENRSR